MSDRILISSPHQLGIPGTARASPDRMNTPAPSLKTDWTRFAAELGAIPCIIDPAVVRQKP